MEMVNGLLCISVLSCEKKTMQGKWENSGVRIYKRNILNNNPNVQTLKHKMPKK